MPNKKVSEIGLPLIHHIYLVRHGDVDLSPDICYGQLDCGVTHSIKADVLRLNDFFDAKLSFMKNNLKKDINAESPIIISSPLRRCYQLAKGLQIQSTMPFKLQTNDAFKEMDFGLWEGKSWQSIGQSQIEEWNQHFFDYTFPKGENAQLFFQRVVSAWRELMAYLSKQQKPQTIILISHAGVIRAILSHFLGMPLEQCLTIKIDKMSVSHLTIVPQQLSLSRCAGINYVIDPVI